MSNFVGNKPTPLSILLSGAKKIFKPQKTTGTGAISSVNIAKNLAKKKNIKDDLISSRDKLLAGVRDEAKVEIKSRNPLSKFTKKIEKIVDKKAKGGRVGLKRGTGLGGKSNVAKIKKNQMNILKSRGMKESRFSTIRRWKHGKTGQYILLSMVWYIDIDNDQVEIVAKPIDLTFDGPAHLMN